MYPLVSLHYYAPVRALIHFYLIISNHLYIGVRRDKLTPHPCNRRLCSIFPIGLSRTSHSCLQCMRRIPFERGCRLSCWCRRWTCFDVSWGFQGESLTVSAQRSFFIADYPVGHSANHWLGNSVWLDSHTNTSTGLLHCINRPRTLQNIGREIDIFRQLPQEITITVILSKRREFVCDC